MNRFQRLSLVIGAMFAWLAPAEFATAQDAPTPQKGSLADLKQTVSSLQLSLLRAQAKGDEIKEEQKLLDDAAEGVEPVDFRHFSAPEDVWDDVFEVNAHSAERLGRVESRAREISEKHQRLSKRVRENVVVVKCAATGNAGKTRRVRRQDRVANGFEAFRIHDTDENHWGRTSCHTGRAGAFGSRDPRPDEVAASLTRQPPQHANPCRRFASGCCLRRVDCASR